MRQSAVVGAVLGAAVAAMGVAVMAIAAGAIATPVYLPRALLALQGAGLVLCGACFACVTSRRRLAFAFALPGAVLAFLMPVAWFALTPGTRECSIAVFSVGAGAVSPAVPLDPAECRWVLVMALLGAIAVAVALAFAWRRLGRQQKR